MVHMIMRCLGVHMIMLFLYAHARVRILWNGYHGTMGAAASHRDEGENAFATLQGGTHAIHPGQRRPKAEASNHVKNSDACCQGVLSDACCQGV